MLRIPSLKLTSTPGHEGLLLETRRRPRGSLSVPEEEVVLAFLSLSLQRLRGTILVSGLGPRVRGPPLSCLPDHAEFSVRSLRSGQN